MPSPGRTRTRVVQLTAQCTDHWTTGQSHGVSVPVAQLTMHVKVTPCMVVQSYGHKSKFFRLDRLLLSFCKIMGLRSASSTIMRISVITNHGTHCFIFKPLTMQGFTVSALFMNWSCIMSPKNKFSHIVFKCLH